MKRLWCCLCNIWSCLAEAWRMLRSNEQELDDVWDKYGVL
jgi:hypothetical protein